MEALLISLFCQLKWLMRALGGEEAEAHVLQLLGGSRGDEFRLGSHRANGDDDVLRGQLKIDRDHA